MAQPSSSHHDSHRHHRSSSSHHHRTISSTTLLLVLSLILAVLAVMLSLPSSGASAASGESGQTGSILSALNPKRAQQLISREAAVTTREAEVARREAELLAGAPGGILPSQPSPVICPACPTATAIETVYAPAQTIVQEIVKESALTPPGYNGARFDEIIDRELRVAERERDISKREENLNRRENDSSRREAWIMEQLIALGNADEVEEEYYYEPAAARRKPAKYQYQQAPQELPSVVVSEVFETETMTVVQTQVVTVPPPANTRLAAPAAPEGSDPYSTAYSPRTTAVEIIHEQVTHEEEEVEEYYEEPVRATRPRPTRMPNNRRYGNNWD